MKPRFVIVVLLILGLAVPVSMLAQQSKAEKEVRAVIAKLNEANIKAGADAVAIFEKYLTDDFVRIPPNGAVFTKSDVVNANRAAKSGLEAQDLSDIKIRIYGNTAVVTGILNSKGQSPLGYGAVQQSRWTRVFVKRGGNWQCVLYQNTGIAPPKTEESAAQLKNQLVGTYRLVSAKRTVVATGKTTDVYGQHPQGYVVYGRDGRMMMIYVKDVRPKPLDLAAMTDNERADLFRTMVAYAGTYDFDGKAITHHVDVSWNQAWQVRIKYEL